MCRKIEELQTTQQELCIFQQNIINLQHFCCNEWCFMHIVWPSAICFYKRRTKMYQCTDTSSLCIDLLLAIFIIVISKWMYQTALYTLLFKCFWSVLCLPRHSFGQKYYKNMLFFNLFFLCDKADFLGALGLDDLTDLTNDLMSSFGALNVY